MKDLESRFAEVEKRVRTLVSDNAALRKRITELEAELADARKGSGELENFHGKKMRVREKIENILRSLDAIGEKST